MNRHRVAYPRWHIGRGLQIELNIEFSFTNTLLIVYVRVCSYGKSFFHSNIANTLDVWKKCFEKYNKSKIKYKDQTDYRHATLFYGFGKPNVIF